VVFDQLGVSLEADEAHRLLPLVRQFVARHKHAPDSPDLLELLAAMRAATLSARPGPVHHVLPLAR
jgi:homocitrate synthase NifV